MDEAESKTKKQRARNEELNAGLREASSDTDSQTVISNRSSDGYTVRSFKTVACRGSIGGAVNQAADRARQISLGVNEASHTDESRVKMLSVLKGLQDGRCSRQFITRCFKMADVAIQNIAMVSKALMMRGAQSRQADTHGTIMGAVGILMSDEVLSDTQVELLVKKVDPSIFLGESETDEQQLLEHFLSSTVEMDGLRLRKRISFEKMLRATGISKHFLKSEKDYQRFLRFLGFEVQGQRSTFEFETNKLLRSLKETLGNFGVAWVKTKEYGENIALAHTNKEFKALFLDTQWEVNIADFLRTIPRSSVSTQRIGDQLKKAVLVPLHHIGLDTKTLKKIWEELG